MRELSLKVEKRDGTGKGPNRRLRSEGLVPAIVYGPDSEPIAIKVNYRDLYRSMHGVSLSTIINLDIEGADSRKVLIRDLQKDPVTGELLHIDFHHISMDKPIIATVPVHTVGIPDGVKNFGGIVSMVRREIEVSCLPADIPEEVVLNIEALGVGDSMHVSDIVLENVEILTNPKRTIVTIAAPTVVKEKTVAEGAEGEAAEGAEGEAKEGEGDEKKKEEE
ncbi:MAG: 50S ribosomal protein L25 [Candidatus Zixiibacteriota bacterium]